MPGKIVHIAGKIGEAHPRGGASFRRIRWFLAHLASLGPGAIDTDDADNAALADALGMFRTNKGPALTAMLATALAQEAMANGTIVHTAPTAADFTFHAMNLSIGDEKHVKVAQSWAICNPRWSWPCAQVPLKS
jgi:hypothetical protein